MSAHNRSPLAIPTKQRALFLTERNGNFTGRETDIPTPEPGELLVEVQAAGLNPFCLDDQEYSIMTEKYPAILGYDIASVVKELGISSSRNLDFTLISGLTECTLHNATTYAREASSSTASLPLMSPQRFVVFTVCV